MNRWMVSAFERWLNSRGFASLDEAAVFQKNAVGDDRYRLVDLAVEHVKEAGGTYHTMTSRYSSVRAFFMRKRCELPRVQVDFTPTRDASVGKLSLSSFRLLVDESGLPEKAVYLTLLQGLMDQKRFFDSFNPKGYELACHIKDKGVEFPFRVDFLRGRKGNRHPYNTWIAREALTAWQTYFERERGWPKENEAAVLDQDGGPMSQIAFCHRHIRRLRRLNYTKTKSRKDTGTRYGYNLHELRDLARSLLEKAKEDGFNTNSAEYWMGHTVDPYFYNKI